jgi:hypothetical protein
MSEHRPIVNRILRPSRESNVNARHSTDDGTRELSTVPAPGAPADPAPVTPTESAPVTPAESEADVPPTPEPDGWPDPVQAGWSDPEPVEVTELDADPFDDDLATELDARAPRPKVTRLTLALAGGLLLVIGFLAGSLAQRQWGTTAAPSSPFANGANRGGGNLPGGLLPSGRAGNGGASGAAPVTGTVKLVDGNTVYIVTSDGRVVTVKASGTTTVSQPGKLSDLAAGSSVTVTGQTGSDGTVTANSITRTK